MALTKDGLEGREAGNAGHRKAALYVAAQLERAGLAPVGEDGYVQSVPLHEIPASKSNARTAYINCNCCGISQAARTGLPNTVAGDLVFVSPADPANDLDLKGKIIVRLSSPHWPAAYSSSMTLATTPLPHASDAPVDFSSPRHSQDSCSRNGSSGVITVRLTIPISRGCPMLPPPSTISSHPSSSLADAARRPHWQPGSTFVR